MIDDASHLYEPSLASFETLFPLLRPGGTYIIEDWKWEHEVVDAFLCTLRDPSAPGHREALAIRAAQTGEAPVLATPSRA